MKFTLAMQSISKYFGKPLSCIHFELHFHQKNSYCKLLYVGKRHKNINLFTYSLNQLLEIILHIYIYT